MTDYDIILIGGGIVGVATAWQLKLRYPNAAVLLIEKEQSPAQHQTGHNSGVIHAGVYYAPGSLKADFCKRGAALTKAFCREHALPYEECGKLLVATDNVELQRMADLEERCHRNDIGLNRLSRRELAQREPSINGCGALLIPSTGITDYKTITRTMVQCFRDLGGHFKTASPVTGIIESGRAVKVTIGSGSSVTGRYVIACAGLMADRIAGMMNIEIDFAIVPFRGEYYRLPSKFNSIVKHLIYPIPDPELPFLGVHLTRMIDGSVTVGPNAVLGRAREGYGKCEANFTDLADMLRFPGFWGVVRKNFRSGMAEMRDSFFKTGI